MVMKRKRIKTQSVVYPVGKRQIPGLQSIKTNDIFNFGCNVTTKQNKRGKKLSLYKSFRNLSVAQECRIHYVTFQYSRSSVRRDVCMSMTPSKYQQMSLCPKRSHKTVMSQRNCCPEILARMNWEEKRISEPNPL